MEGPQSSGRTALLRFGCPEHISLPVDRVDQPDGVAVIHLLTELPDADGDRVRITLVVVPDPLLDLLAREHPPLALAFEPTPHTRLRQTQRMLGLAAVKGDRSQSPYCRMIAKPL